MIDEWKIHKRAVKGELKNMYSKMYFITEEKKKFAIKYIMIIGGMFI